MEQASHQKISPRDVFLHLLMIITLYFSAVSFIRLLFQYVNNFFPDPLADYYEAIFQAVRWSVASLLIVFPVFIWVSWFLNKDARRHPEKRELRLRKWLINLTLFIAALVAIGDLVNLIYNFLGGDLTARFLLKTLAVLVVAALIFAYYLWDLRRDIKEPAKKLRWLVWVLSAVVAASIVGGFFVAGTPAQQRSRRFDERRVGDLQVLQNEIINYWMRKESLPRTLDDLSSDLTGFRPPTDPASGVDYVYHLSDKLTFELCAVFTTDRGESADKAGYPRPAAPYGYPYEAQNWSHGQGETCFKRTIDPEIHRLPKPARDL